MNPTLADYNAYVAEYDKQLEIIQEMNGDTVPFDIGPKLNKAAFSGAFQIKDAMNLGEGIEMNGREIAQAVAREQLFWASPKKASNALEKWNDPELLKNFPTDIQGQIRSLTHEDLLYGTEKARNIVSFLDKERARLAAQDTGPAKGRATRVARQIAQLYFGS